MFTNVYEELYDMYDVWYIVFMWRFALTSKFARPQFPQSWLERTAIDGRAEPYGSAVEKPLVSHTAEEGRELLIYAANYLNFDI